MSCIRFSELPHHTNEAREVGWDDFDNERFPIQFYSGKGGFMGTVYLKKIDSPLTRYIFPFLATYSIRDA